MTTTGRDALTRGERDYVGTSTTRTHWNPLELIDLVEGLRRGDTIISIQGRDFKIRYIDEHRFYYKPVEGIKVPQGYSDLRRLELKMESM